MLLLRVLALGPVQHSLIPMLLLRVLALGPVQHLLVPAREEHIAGHHQRRDARRPEHRAVHRKAAQHHLELEPRRTAARLRHMPQGRRQRHSRKALALAKARQAVECRQRTRWLHAVESDRRPRVSRILKWLSQCFTLGFLSCPSI